MIKVPTVQFDSLVFITTSNTNIRITLQGRCFKEDEIYSCEHINCNNLESFGPGAKSGFEIDSKGLFGNK